MFINKITNFFKNACLIYYNNFSKIITLGLQFSLVCILATIALISSEFPVLDVVTFKNFMNFNVDEKFVFAVAQEKIFSFSAGWTLLVLSIAKISPLIIRVFYIAMLVLIHFCTIGFIRSLCLIYDNKKTYFIDLFFSYKAVIRHLIVSLLAICIVLLFYFLIKIFIVCTSFYSPLDFVSAISIVAPQIGSFIGCFLFHSITLCFFLGVLFLTCVELMICIISYGAIASEDSLISIMRQACNIRLRDMFLSLSTIIILCLFLLIGFFGKTILVVTSPIYTVIYKIIFNGCIILPFSTFVFYGLYKTTQKKDNN